MSSFFPKKKGGDAQAKSKKQGSRAFRAKKFMASALASSSTGRSTLGKLVGHDGEDLLKALVSVEAVRSGQEGGKALNVDVFKVAGKVGLLISNKVVTPEQLEDGLPPLFEAGMTLLNACNAPRGGGLHTIPQISEGISSAAEHLHDTVSAHMQEKNSAKILACSETLSDPEYLRLLLTDASLANERAEVAASIEGLLESGSMKAANENLKAEMRKRLGRLSQAMAVGDFKALTKNPETKRKFTEFLADGGGGGGGLPWKDSSSTRQCKASRR